MCHCSEYHLCHCDDLLWLISLNLWAESDAGADRAAFRNVSWLHTFVVKRAFVSDPVRKHTRGTAGTEAASIHRRVWNLDLDPKRHLICESRLLSPSLPLVLYLPMTQCAEADLRFNRETLKCLLMPNKYAWLQSAGDAPSANVLIKLFW